MNIDAIQFENWHWLLLLPLLWLIILWWFLKPRPHQVSSIVDTDLSNYNHFYHPLADKLITAKRFSKTRSKRVYFWQKSGFWFLQLSFSALIIALAQPILLGKRLPDPPPERDIVFLVDTSLSMQLKDYTLADQAISRMALLRNLLDEFTTKMKGEKISVILFAEKPYILVPLSNDQALIRSMLKRITTTLAGRYTAVGDALLMALKEAQKQADRHQTIILFTDADTSRGETSASAAAQVVGEHGIPIFTIGIGSSQKSENEVIAGGLYHPVNLALLEDIAKRSQGKSYQVNNADAMQQALHDILLQRKNIAMPKAQYEHQTLYFYPLGFALLMLSLWQLYRLALQSQKKLKTAQHKNPSVEKLKLRS